MTAAQQHVTRLAALRAIRAWVREETPRMLFEVALPVAYTVDKETAVKDIVEADALTIALAEMAAKFLIALHLDAAGAQPTAEEYRAARDEAESWLDEQILAGLDFEVDPPGMWSLPTSRDHPASP